MRGAPQYGFALAIRLIKPLTSELACGRPSRFRREILAPIESEPFTLPAHDRLSLDQLQGPPPRAQIRESTTQNNRSFLFSLGTAFLLFSTLSCCRRARFSKAKSRRSLTAVSSKTPSHRSISIMGCSVRGTA